MAFQQAPLAVEKVAEFEELKRIVVRAVSGNQAERFLGLLAGDQVRVRDFEGALKRGAFDRIVKNESAKGEKDRALKLYQGLPVLDQAQVREFYLSKIEDVPEALRAKFRKLYSYY